MRKLVTVLFVALLCGGALTARAQPSIIETVAGGGPNHLPALSANLSGPRSLAVDAGGNLFIVAETQHRVFRVDSAGQLSVVAGNGVPGFSGDGGPAIDASLSHPFGVAVDSSGNLFISDNNQRIRRVDAATGIITTVAGNGTFGFSGDGGPATSAHLADPAGLAVDSTGNLFIADQGNHRIRRVDAASGIITTVAGSSGLQGCAGDGALATNACLRFPLGVSVDAGGNLYIADTNNHRIRRVNAVTRIITTVAGTGIAGFSGDGGLATGARLNSPFGVAVDSTGKLYIADFNNQRIRRVNLATGIITTVAGNGIRGFGGDGGAGANASLADPFDVAVGGSGDLLIADGTNNRIRRLDAAGIITTVAGNGTGFFSGDGGPATDASIGAFGVAADSAGTLFIADTKSLRIRQTDAATGTITTVAGNGLCCFSGDGGTATSARLAEPFAVALDSAGNLFFTDRSVSQRIRRVNASTGIITTVAGNGLRGFSGDGGLAISASLRDPSGVAVDLAGNVFIADTFNHRIRRVDAATGIITTIAGTGASGFGGDGGSATTAMLSEPFSVAVKDAAELFIADRNNNRVRRIDMTTGIITTVAGNGLLGFSGDGGPATSASLAGPLGVAVDSVGGLLIGDTNNNRVRRVDLASGIITTVAGNGTFGFGGDGGSATSARLAFPSAVAGDATGAVFVVDTSNQRIRRVSSLNQPPTANAGPDQAVSAGASCHATLSLNGSASADPNDDVLRFTWTGSFGAASGPTPTVTLPLGTHTIVLTVDDGKGGAASDTVVVTVRDTTPPVFSNIPAPMTVEQTGPAGASFSVSFPNASDNCSGVLTVASDAPTVFPPGTTTVTFTATDSAGNRATATTTVTVVDTVPPTTTAAASPGPNGNGWNNADVTVTLSATDGASGVKEIYISLTGAQSAAGVVNGPVTIWAEGTTTVTYFATDNAGNAETAKTFAVHIDKTAPVIAVNTPAAFAVLPVGSVLDFDVSDAVSGLQSQTSLLSDGTSSVLVTDGQAIAQPGVYTLTVAGTDRAGNSAPTVLRFFVVYDPTAGFATGGGWFVPGGSTSDPGDVLPGLDSASPAQFGFVIKYQPGAKTPEGELEFHYKHGNLDLHSTGMEWLVVVNNNWVRFQGKASIKGSAGEFPFRVEARDGDQGGGTGADRFTIRIWSPDANPDTTGLMYKGSGDLQGGSILIHTK